jgi:UPF0716 family protein affecting phage T7 exclusion
MKFNFKYTYFLAICSICIPQYLNAQSGVGALFDLSIDNLDNHGGRGVGEFIQMIIPFAMAFTFLKITIDQIVLSIRGKGKEKEEAGWFVFGGIIGILSILCFGILFGFLGIGFGFFFSFPVYYRIEAWLRKKDEFTLAYFIITVLVYSAIPYTIYLYIGGGFTMFFGIVLIYPISQKLNQILTGHSSSNELIKQQEITTEEMFKLEPEITINEYGEYQVEGRVLPFKSLHDARAAVKRIKDKD